MRPGRNKEKYRDREAERPWYLKPGDFLYRRLPLGFRKDLYLRIERYFRRRQAETEEMTRLRTGRFLLEQLSILFWGFLFVLIVAAICAGLLLFKGDEINFVRNPFGQGEKKEELRLENEDGKQTFPFIIEEQTVSEKELSQIYHDFFLLVEKNMQGDNKSLEKVNRNLHFPDQLAPYPFLIEYEPEETNLIGFDGELGEDALEIREDETRRTWLKVTASYRDYSRSKYFLITLVAPPKKRPLTSYEKTFKKIQKMEEDSREKAEFTIPTSLDDISIMIPGSSGKYYALIFLSLLVPLFFCLRRYSQLKEEDKKREKEEQEDFPLIVHLFTLYMNAGLSFSSTVYRISRNYKSSEKAGKRYAFEEITVMHKQMDMGVSQKEACISWGKRSRNPLYQRLSAALVQILVKGSKEGERILSRMEKDAFEERIDRARKEGKLAETRLLFPMMILLCLAMAIVLFPAVLRFQGF